MRKVFSFIAAAVFLTAAAAVNNAYAIGVGASTITAKVAFTGAGTYSWDIELRNISNDASTGAITWSGVTAASTGWKTADQYVVFTGSITASNFSVKLYTDNANGTEFKYTGSTPTAQDVGIGGLVSKNSPDSATSVLPMSWRMFEVQASSTLADVKSFVQDISGDNSVNITPEAPVGQFAMPSYFIDKSNGSFNSTDDVNYSSILKGNMWRFGQGEGDRAALEQGGQRYIFFGAKFTGATTPNEYGTDTIIFEGLIE